jgi:hypothetical protein
MKINFENNQYCLLCYEAVKHTFKHADILTTPITQRYLKKRTVVQLPKMFLHFYRPQHPITKFLFWALSPDHLIQSTPSRDTQFRCITYYIRATPN